MNFVSLLLILLLNMATVSQIMGNRHKGKRSPDRFYKDYDRFLRRQQTYLAPYDVEQYNDAYYRDKYDSNQRQEQLLKDIVDDIRGLKQDIAKLKPRVQLVVPMPYIMLSANENSNIFDALKQNDEENIKTKTLIEGLLENRYGDDTDKNTLEDIVPKQAAHEKPSNCHAASLFCCKFSNSKINECFDRHNCNTYKCSNSIVVDALNILINTSNLKEIVGS